jgi:hypothetical protein
MSMFGFGKGSIALSRKMMGEEDGSDEELDYEYITPRPAEAKAPEAPVKSVEQKEPPKYVFAH